MGATLRALVLLGLLLCSTFAENPAYAKFVTCPG